MNTTWTIKIERMEIRLPVGIYADEIEPQTVWVSVTASGIGSASPQSLDQCFDYEPLCHWLTQVWPHTPHTPLLETRINQLLGFIFELDSRLETAWVGIYKKRMSVLSTAVGIERSTSRAAFYLGQRPRTQAVARPPLSAAAEPSHKENPYAVITS